MLDFVPSRLDRRTHKTWLIIPLPLSLPPPFLLKCLFVYLFIYFLREKVSLCCRVEFALESVLPQSQPLLGFEACTVERWVFYSLNVLVGAVQKAKFLTPSYTDSQ